MLETTNNMRTTLATVATAVTQMERRRMVDDSVARAMRLENSHDWEDPEG